MGGTCCKATFNPNKVHIKKINEIFTNCMTSTILFMMIRLEESGGGESTRERE
jgi:hypothetical protein